MPRQSRIVFENSLYEVVPRARDMLPLPSTNLTWELQAGILARTQRDNKVILCHFIDMNNHSHQLCIPKEAQNFSKFYMEYQKKVADSVRKLGRLRRLTLWEGRPGVILIDGVQDVINRLVYIYLNPVRAGLVKRIEDYPGFNTWQAFISCAPEVDATVKINAHWIPVSAMDSLPKNNKLSSSEDTNMVSAIKRSKHTIKYELEIQPFKWLEKFGITDPVKIEEIRQIVIGRVKEEEQNLQAERELRSARVIGANRLREQEYLKAHTPDKKGRKIFLICCDNDRRPTLIDQFKSIIDKCKECYKALKDGLPHEWPPGTYVPWIPPTLCRAPLSG